MEHDNLETHLNSLQCDDCYRVEKVLKESEYETTQLVYFVGSNGAEQGPFIRKYLSTSLGIGSAYQTIFEAQSGGKRFKHLPLIFDCYKMGDSLTVIMEYVSGETLQDLVYRLDPSAELAIRIFPKICDGILELHEEFPYPIIHRDLKPSNIMLSDNSLMLIDFGISRQYNEEADQDTFHFGTRSYAPPEQFGFGQTNVKSDVYSLGMLLYYCLTEKTPAPQAREEGFADPLIPPYLRKILVVATALDPEQRYANVGTMKAAFLQAVSQRDSVDPQPSPQTSRMPNQGAAPLSQTQPNHEKKTVLSAIPRPLGIVWNILILIVMLYFCWIGWGLFFNPDTFFVIIPLFERFLLIASTILLCFGSVAFLLLDKRAFEKTLPAVAQLSLRAQIFLSLAVFAVGALLVIIVTRLLQM